MKNFFLKTFGCQMNIFDSSLIKNILFKNNYNIINNYKLSDIIILNTCSIREDSGKKIFFFLKKKIKKIFIITGCLSVIFTNFLLRNENIKIILGPSNIKYINILINMYYYNKCKQISIEFYKNNNYNKNTFNKNHYLTIMEGCNKYCSYCIVPYTRGREFSKDISFILNFLIKKKFFFRINLLGQNVNSYLWILFNIKNKYIDFCFLLKYITEFYFIKYINFISSHIKNFNKKIFFIYKNNSKICNFLHLPLQSSSNRVLLKMNRNYSILDYLFVLDNIKYNKKEIFITTDIILGFINEKNIDFNKTLIFFEKFLFDRSYIFKYNPRPYTKIYFFKKNFLKNKLKFRFLKIRNKMKNNVIYLNKNLLNKIEIIIVKCFSLEFNDIYIGVLNDNRIIKFFFKNFFNFKLINKFIKIKILNKIFNYFLAKII